MLVAVWLFLSITLFLIAAKNVSTPGLYYDEALFGGMAKDFITGETHGAHLPNHLTVNVANRPFPVYVQAYLGAVKSWLLLPACGLFGTDVAVLRLTTLGWSLLALLLCMLWIWRWLGIGPALTTGALLACDPTFFFISVLDWGSVTPSFLCRFAAFYLVVRWCQNGRTAYAFFAAFFAGIGFFNKIDFAVILGATGVAAICCYLNPLRQRLQNAPMAIAAACAGFLLTSSPMLINLPGIWSNLRMTGTPGPSGELAEKLNTSLAMYDGSYFYRLMNVGGLFEEMFQHPIALSTPFGLVVLITFVILAVYVIRGRQKDGQCRSAAFLLITTGLLTIGVFVLPGAVRIHHAVLVYPFPHVLVAFGLQLLWRKFAGTEFVHRAIRILAPAAFGFLLLAQVLAIWTTNRLIAETGGRGRWSNAFDQFCEQVKHRSDLTIVSLDWGFNEQLLFLTRGPRLIEPFWMFGGTLPSTMPRGTNYIYLVHPPEYSLVPYGTEYLKTVEGAADVEIEPHYDRQQRIVFYAIRFRSP